MSRYFKSVGAPFKKNDTNTILPTRATKCSAGYDFYSPITFTIVANSYFQLWTDIKCCMEKNEFLMIVPRSSLGIKKNIVLKNTMGVIDSDYYSNSENDGNIGICLYNYGENNQIIEVGEKLCQGIFLNYLKVDNDCVSEERIGGTGSTSNM